MPLDCLEAKEAALLLSALGDGPAEDSLDGRDIFVKLMPVEAQAGLQSQGVSGAKTDPLGERFALGILGLKGFNEGENQLLGNRDFEAVFASVSAARNANGLTLVLQLFGGHEIHVTQVDSDD